MRMMTWRALSIRPNQQEPQSAEDECVHAFKRSKVWGFTVARPDGLLELEPDI